MGYERAVLKHSWALMGTLIMLATNTLQAERQPKRIRTESIIPVQVAKLTLRLPKRDFAKIRSDIPESENPSGRPMGIFFEKIRHDTFDEVGYLFGESGRPYRDQLATIALSKKVPSAQAARYLQRALAKCVQEWGTGYKKFIRTDDRDRRLPVLIWEGVDKIIVLDYIPSRTAKSLTRPTTFAVRIVLPEAYYKEYQGALKVELPTDEEKWMFQDLVAALGNK